jgi:transcriptional regulator with XRE-family HTH domain
MRPQPEQSDLARQVMDLRRERHLTQADISRLTGVAKSEISRFECGRSAPTTRTIDRIAKALGSRMVLVPIEKPANEPSEPPADGVVGGLAD